MNDCQKVLLKLWSDKDRQDLGGLISFPPKNFSNRNLVNRLHDQFVNVDVRRTAGDPDKNFRDVSGHERIRVFVKFFRALSVAFETHE